MPKHNPSLKPIFETPRIWVQFFLGWILTSICLIKIPSKVATFFLSGQVSLYVYSTSNQSNQIPATSNWRVEDAGINQNRNGRSFRSFKEHTNPCGTVAVILDTVLRLQKVQIFNGKYTIKTGSRQVHVLSSAQNQHSQNLIFPLSSLLL